MSTVTPLITVDDLAGIPDDGNRRELYAGELVTMSPAGIDHGGYSLEIAHRLKLHVDANQLGRVVGADVGFLLQENPDTLLCPDAAFIRLERLPSIKKRGSFCIGPPDLAVEVLSPSDRIKDAQAKALTYLEFGTLEVWVVNPRDRTLTIFATGGEPLQLLNSESVKDRRLLPGFECQVSDLIGTEF